VDVVDGVDDLLGRHQHGDDLALPAWARTSSRPPTSSGSAVATSTSSPSRLMGQEAVLLGEADGDLGGQVRVQLVMDGARAAKAMPSCSPSALSRSSSVTARILMRISPMRPPSVSCSASACSRTSGVRTPLSTRICPISFCATATSGVGRRRWGRRRRGRGREPALPREREQGRRAPARARPAPGRAPRAAGWCSPAGAARAPRGRA
jgi:hypothetical protein